MDNYKQNEDEKSIKLNIVIFTGGKAPSPLETKAFWEKCESMRENIKDSLLVIAADSGLETLEQYSAHFNFLAPDILIGDWDSIKDKALLEKYRDKDVSRFIKDKNYTDTELAVNRAHDEIRARGLSRNQASITIIGGAGGRADHFLSIFSMFGTQGAPDAWFTEEQALYDARPGVKITADGLTEDDAVSVARAMGFPEGGLIETEGLEWEWYSFRRTGLSSISNRICKNGGRARFWCRDGRFVVILPVKCRVEISFDDAMHDAENFTGRL